MRHLVFALALLGATATGAQAQTAIPDLKGTWSGKGKSIVFGSHAHHPGSQTPNDPPRVRDIEATYVVEGQDGRLVWGRSASAVADTKEPFAWAISSDNKTIVGADMDGYFLITLVYRSDGEVLHPQRRGRRQIGGRHLPRDGPQALARSSENGRGGAATRQSSAPPRPPAGHAFPQPFPIDSRRKQRGSTGAAGPSTTSGENRCARAASRTIIGLGCACLLRVEP